ncbi:MAG: hypothetical protein OEY72_04095 [Gammaproteobacteria bacterium]|nr:hypothetical protein [Gammaproteobacteria bacterium]
MVFVIGMAGTIRTMCMIGMLRIFGSPGAFDGMVVEPIRGFPVCRKLEASLG